MSQLRLAEFCDIVDDKGKCWNASVQRLASPQDPNPSGGSANAPVPVPKVLVPTEGKTATASSHVGLKDEVLLVWSPQFSIPDGSAVIHGSLLGVEDYDNIRIVMKDVSNYTVEYETPHINSVTSQ